MKEHNSPVKIHNAKYDVPFCLPNTAGKELVYMMQAVENHHFCGDGQFGKKVQLKLETITHAKKVLLTTSCTHALEMCAILLDIKPGDEVILPSFTFVSTVNAFVLRGAKPIFVDIRPDTLNIDENLVESHINQNTKAIILVHYAGIACEMTAFTALARKYNIAIIEDNAHGLFGKYNKQPLGSFGRFSTLSFHETKNLTCGEGGALLLNQSEDITRAEIIREKGTNRNQFFRGEVNKYEWKDIGSSYVLSDLLAAFLYGQLEMAHEIQSRRKYIFNYYLTHLRDWAQANGIQLPFVPTHCDPAYHLFYMIMPTPEMRDQLIAHLRAHRINPTFHYLPLHKSEIGKRLSGGNFYLPVTEYSSDRLVRLPFYNSMTEEDLGRVTSAIHQYNTQSTFSLAS